MAGTKVLPHDHPLLTPVRRHTHNQFRQPIRNKQVTQHNNLDEELNPIVNWAETVTRLRSYPGFSPSWEVYKFYDILRQRK